MADDFSYNVRVFKATWNDLVELCSLLAHTVMTTSTHRYSRHCLELFHRRQTNWLGHWLVQRGWRSKGARGHDTAGRGADHHSDRCGRVFKRSRARRWSSRRRWRLTRSYARLARRACAVCWLPETGSYHWQLPTQGSGYERARSNVDLQLVKHATPANWHLCARPHQKLLGDGLSTPITPFSLICTISSELSVLLD